MWADKNAFIVLLLLLLTSGCVQSLNNGLARTPPMGWLTWNAFGCQVDCDKHPKTCISENLMIEMADIVVKEGFRDAGYVYVNLDDCWLAKERDAHGRLQPDPKRFPHGIKWLAKYMHDRGLKLGIYEDFGTKTCAGYPGVIDHLKLDAETLASWDIDMLKLDGCHAKAGLMATGFPAFGNYLNKTGRPVLYSCEWPLYEWAHHITPNYTNIGEHCNTFRNYRDIKPHWESFMGVVDFYDAHLNDWRVVQRPGRFFDPDMLLIGEHGITLDQAKAQLCMWSLYSAPLLMSTDLRKLKPEFKKLLLSPLMIQVNQDPAGIMGALVKRIGDDIRIYTKVLSPTADNTWALVILNTGNETQEFDIVLEDIGLVSAAGDMFLQDVFTGEWREPFYGEISFNAVSFFTYDIGLSVPTGIIYIQDVFTGEWTEPYFGQIDLTVPATSALMFIAA